jgi:TolA-binding protein
MSFHSELSKTELTTKDPKMSRVRSAISPKSQPKSRNLLLAIAIGTVFGMTSLGSQTVHAQDANMSRQVEQLRKDLDLLQRYVYREGTGDAAQALAPSGDGGASTPAAARQQVQISALERTTTQLTGQLEEFDYRIRMMEDRLERLVADIDFRLSQLEGGAVSSSTGSDAATGQGSNVAPVTGQGGSGTGEALNDRGTQLFGVIESEGQPPQIPTGTAVTSAPAPTQSAAATTGTPEEQYREAFGLLRKQDFAAAEQALSRFVANHPNDPLAGNARSI